MMMMMCVDSSKFRVWVSMFDCWFLKERFYVPCSYYHSFPLCCYYQIAVHSFIHKNKTIGNEDCSKLTMVIWQFLHYRKPISHGSTVSKEVTGTTLGGVKTNTTTTTTTSNWLTVYKVQKSNNYIYTRQHGKFLNLYIIWWMVLPFPCIIEEMRKFLTMSSKS